MTTQSDIANAAPEADPSSIRQSIKNSFFKPRVLVVDDESRVRQSCQKFLKQEGCDVEAAEDGTACLEMIFENHYDIILLDIMMPGISGLEVLQKVKSLHPDTVVIVISGYATLDHSITAMKKGAFDFLSKPFSPKDLRIVICKAIEFIRTLQDIATEKSRMRVMINNLCNGVLTTDSRKKVVLANLAFLKMMGCSISGVIGRPVSDLVSDERVLEMIEAVMVQPEDKFNQVTEEITVRDAEKTEEMILGVRCMPFRDRLNRNLGAITLVQDITALKKVDQLKSDFVSMVAHELKSPLNSILMQLNVVLDGLAGDLTEKQRLILGRNYDRILSLSNLTAELLDLSKMESGLINQEREKLDITRIMMDQADLYLERAAEKGITITTDADAPVHIMANRHNMEEVLANLITNAIRYSPDGGEIGLSVGASDDAAVIKVSDTGLGIPEGEQENIFNKFYRVKNRQTRFINGTGLGLSIVKSIVVSHHGSIDVESTECKGSTFTVTLPVSQTMTDSVV